MESAKKKRKSNGGIDERRTKSLETNEKQTTTATSSTSTSTSTRTIEDEAEEFFAILRRFHTAVRHYKKETSNESKFKQRDLRFDQLKTGMQETVGGVKNQGKREEEAVEENFLLDLNLLPNTDTNI